MVATEPLVATGPADASGPADRAGPAKHALRRPSGPVWSGLVQLLTGPDPVPVWRSGRRRRAANFALPVGALALLLLMTRRGDPFFPVALAVAPLPLAARYPLLGWRIGWLGLLFVSTTFGDGWGGSLATLLPVPALLVVFCVAGVRHPRPVLWWMWGLTLAPWWLWNGLQGPYSGGHVIASLVFTVAAIVVDNVRSRRHAEDALAAAAELTELEQARRAVLQERTRIARELHDVVAHHMSLIAVRAETAPYRLSGLSEPVQAEFASLSGAAREALADMRRLLGVLRADQAAERAPQPQLSDLPELVETARQAGMAVELSMPATLGHVPSSVAVCAYRLAQESLSNASRHAPGAAVRVSIAESGGALRLMVVNGPGGPGVPADNHDGPGHGLAGMRERAALLGGSLTAGPSPDGGFAVDAILPIEAQP